MDVSCWLPTWFRATLLAMSDDIKPRQEPTTQWRARDSDNEMKFVVHRWPDGEVTLALDRDYTTAEIDAL